MTMPSKLPRHPVSRLLVAATLIAAGAALAGCETTGIGVAQATPTPAQPPMTHTRAAEECWMGTEHGHADLPLDQRANIVEKCIKQKLGEPQGGQAQSQQANAAKP